MKIRIDKDYKIHVTCNDLDVEDMNKRLRFLKLWIDKRIGSEKETTGLAIVSSQTVSSEKPEIDNPETDYKPKPIKKKPSEKYSKLTKPQINWLYKEYDLRISRIPEKSPPKLAKEKEVKIKKDIAKLLGCFVSNVDYWLGKRKIK